MNKSAKYILLFALIICILALTGCNSEKIQENLNSSNNLGLNQNDSIDLCDTSGKILLNITAGGGHGSFGISTISNDGVYISIYKRAMGHEITYSTAKLSETELELFRSNLENFDIDSFIREVSSEGVGQRITFVETNQSVYVPYTQTPKFIKDLFDLETKPCEPK